MIDLNTKKLHDEIAKELFLDAVYRKQEPKSSAVLAMINAQVFITARAAYWAAQDAADALHTAKHMPVAMLKGCSACNGAGKVRPAGMSKNKQAPICRVCNGAGKVAVTP